MPLNQLDLSPVLTLTRPAFYKLCQHNPDLKLERTARGELIVMSPTGGETGTWNADLIAQVAMWNRATQMGKAFDSSTGFALPLGSDRSPDVAWVSLDKWQALTPEQRKDFFPLCLDFVIELLSSSDSWNAGSQKMAEYMDNGCRLGWLIDPKSQRVAIYRSGQTAEVFYRPQVLSGENVLVDFCVDLSTIWQET